MSKLKRKYETNRINLNNSKLRNSNCNSDIEIERDKEKDNEELPILKRKKYNTDKKNLIEINKINKQTNKSSGNKKDKNSMKKIDNSIDESHRVPRLDSDLLINDSSKNIIKIDKNDTKSNKGRMKSPKNINLLPTSSLAESLIKKDSDKSDILNSSHKLIENVTDSSAKVKR